MKKYLLFPIILLLSYCGISNAQPLSGSYNIDYSLPTGGSNFQSFSDAIDTLAYHGISGPVMFLVFDGVYNEQIVIPQISGSSANDSIMFMGASADSTAVILEYQSSGFDSNFTILLNGADNIFFRHLTVRATGTSYGHAIEYRMGANNTKFSGCVIEGVVTTDVSDDMALVYSAGGNDTSAVYVYSEFRNGSWAIIANGQSTMSPEPDMVLRFNLFKDQYVGGIAARYQSGAYINKNYIVSSSAFDDWRAISIGDCPVNLNITANRISAQLSQSATGIYLTNSNSTFGLEKVIANNFIHVNGQINATSGIFIDNSSYIFVYYNSVFVTGSNDSCAAFRIVGSGSYVTALNNIFSNKAGGYSFDLDPLFSGSTTNYNDFVTDGAVLINLAGTTYDNLTDWFNDFGNDEFSISEQPAFFSNSDLHIFNWDPVVDGMGYKVTGINTDIDGQYRDASFPDIGADEYDYVEVTEPIPSDLFLCGPGSDTLFVDGINSPGVCVWYANESDQSSIHSGNYYVTPYLTQDTEYWIENDSLGFVSVRIPIFVFIDPLPGDILDTIQGGDTLSVVVLNDSLCEGSDAVFHIYNSEPGVLYELKDYNTYTIIDTITGNGSTIVLSDTAIAAPMTYTICALDEFTGCYLFLDSLFDVALFAAPAGISWTDTTVCEGVTVNIMATGGTSYLWGNGSTSTSIISNGVTPETYYVTISTNHCTIVDSATVNFHPLPVIIPSQDTLNLCASSQATISVSGALSYYWSPPTGLNATTNDTVTVEASLIGTGITYYVQGTDANGCTGDTSIVVIVSGSLSVSLDASYDTICPGESTTITATSPGTNFVWAPTGFGNPTVVTPIVTTTYTVTVDDGAGCSGTDDIIIYVIAIPTPVVTGSVNVLASTTETYSTTDNSASGNAYSWSVSGGAILTGQGTASISVQWSSGTSGWVSVYESAAGCYDVDTLQITISSTSYYPDISGQDTICGLNVTGSYTTVDNTASGSTYLWSTTGGTIVSGQGTATVYVEWATAGIVELAVSETNGPSTNTDTLQIFVDDLSFANAGPDQGIGCIASSVQIGSLAQAGVTYSWSPAVGLDNPTTAQPIASPSSTTSYTLSAINSNTGCQATDLVIVTVSSNVPTANAGVDQTIDCQNSSVMIGSSAMPNCAYSWQPQTALSDPYDNRPVATPLVSTTYTVTVTDTISQCTATDEVVVSVVDKPLADFSVSSDSVVVGETVTITFTGNSGAISTYNWNFGGAQIISGSGEGPYSVKWMAAGSKQTCLTVVDTTGCSSAQNCIPVLVEEINTTCEADFSYTELSTYEYEFTATGSYLFFWEFEDGSHTYGQQVSNTFPGAGFFDVCLTVTETSTGCQDVQCMQIAIDTATGSYCNADFTYTNTGSNNVQFTAINTGQNVTHYYWTFGDGTVSIAQNPLKHYAVPGIYTVYLKVFSDSTDCYDVTMQHVETSTATDDCEALFFWTPEPTGTTIHFSNHSVGAGVNQFIWNFGDDSIASVYQQSYSYSEPGYYNVCLTAISTTTGCSNITCATVFTSDISDNVDADFEYTVDSLTNNVIFFDNSTGNISEWEWEFGDGDTSTAENPQHQYVQMGVYQVHLKITGASGSVSHAFRLISSTPYFGDLTASFGYVLDTLSKSEQYPADFKGAAFGDPAVISWSFGDGGVDSTTMFPYHIYEESGIYNACFTVSDPQCGTEDTYCQDIVIGNASIGEYADHGFISRIFPNPASEKLFVMMGTNVAGKFDLSVSDLSGRKVSEDVSVSCHAGTQIVSLDISGLKPGVYFVRIESEIAGITHKLVISR